MNSAGRQDKRPPSLLACSLPRLSGTTATATLSPRPAAAGSDSSMAQASGQQQFYGMWSTHPDSPFVPLAAAARLSLQRMNFANLPAAQQAAAAASRQPDSMQVDSTAGAAAAGSSTAPLGSASGASTNPSEAGPSGLQPGATYDAQMANAQQSRPTRKHSDAPMRKLSVSLIDTYKLINQVGAFFSRNEVIERRWRALARGGGRVWRASRTRDEGAPSCRARWLAHACASDTPRPPCAIGASVHEFESSTRRAEGVQPFKGVCGGCGARMRPTRRALLAGCAMRAGRRRGTHRAVPLCTRATSDRLRPTLRK